MDDCLWVFRLISFLLSLQFLQLFPCFFFFLFGYWSQGGDEFFFPRVYVFYATLSFGLQLLGLFESPLVFCRFFPPGQEVF